MPPPPKIKIVKTLSKQLLVHDVRGMPRSLAEQGAEGFRSLCDSFDIEATRLEQTCPGIEKALEQSPLAALLRGKLAERNNQHRFRHAAVYVSYMHKELAFVHRAQFSVEAGDKNAGKGKQPNTLLLPHRMLLRYLDIPTTLPLAEQTTALQGMEIWLSLHNQTQLWGGKQFDQELLNSYSLDWPYAIFALQKSLMSYKIGHHVAPMKIRHPRCLMGAITLMCPTWLVRRHRTYFINRMGCAVC